MDIKQIEAFVYVVEMKSFSKAAEKIFLSQPTISAHVSSLEKELGTQLLVRSTKEVYPTKTGQTFYTYAKNILSLRDQALYSVNKMNEDTKGEIQILASSVPSQYFLPEIIGQFQRKYPKIVFRVEQTDSTGVLNALEEYQYDFGIVGTKINSSKFDCIPIIEDTLSVITPNAPEITEKNVTKDLGAFLKDHPIVMREDGSGTRKELELLFDKLKIRLDEVSISAYFSNTQSIIHAVSRGVGISVVSNMSAALYADLGLIKSFDVDRSFFSRKFYLLLKKDIVLPPIQSEFVEFLKSYYMSAQ